MATCSEIEALLGAFEDGELEPHEMQEVARHIAQCINCEATLRDFGALGRRLRDCTLLPGADGFVEAVRERIDEIHVPMRARVRNYFDRLSERSVATVAVGSAAVAVLAWVAVVAGVPRRNFNNFPQTLTMRSDALRASSQSSEPMTLAQAPTPVFGPEHRTVISRLEADMPDVAVWDEPDTATTVIWMPEAAPE